MPKRTKQEVPQQEEQDQEQSNTDPDIPSTQETMKALMLKIDELQQENKELKETYSKMQENDNVEDKSVDEKGKQDLQENGILKVLKDILANEIEEFQVNLRSFDKMMNELVIIPPDHLKEEDNDTRICVIPTIGGEEDARAYTLKVKEHCVKWANKRGVTSGFKNIEITT